MTRSRLTALLTAAWRCSPRSSVPSAGRLRRRRRLRRPTAPAARSAPPPRPRRHRGRSSLIGTGGITWSDVSPSGHARAVVVPAGRLDGRAVGALGHTNTCPVDGWLASRPGSGRRRPRHRRLARPRPADPCPPIRPSTAAPCPAGPPTSAPRPPRSSTPASACSASSSPARAAASRRSAPARGVRRRVPPRGHAPVCRVRRPTRSRPPLARVPGDARRRGLGARPRGRRPADELGARARPGRAGQGDRPRIGQVLEPRRPPAPTCVVASLSDAGASERLRLVAAQGPALRPAAPWTRPRPGRPGWSRLADLTVTLLARCRRPGARRARRRGPAARPGRQQLRGRGPRPAARAGRLRPGLARGALAWCRRSSTASSTPSSPSTPSSLLVWRRDFGSPQTRGCGCCRSCVGSA